MPDPNELPDDESPLAIGAVCQEDGCRRVLDNPQGRPAWCVDHDPQSEYAADD